MPTIEEQREKQKRLSTDRPQKGIQRLVNGKVVWLSKKENKAHNRKYKRPYVVYGYNTNK